MKFFANLSKFGKNLTKQHLEKALFCCVLSQLADKVFMLLNLALCSKI